MRRQDVREQPVVALDVVIDLPQVVSNIPEQMTDVDMRLAAASTVHVHRQRVLERSARALELQHLPLEPVDHAGVADPVGGEDLGLDLVEVDAEPRFTSR